MKKKIIFSAINVTSGGPLTIVQKFMEFASANLTAEYEVWFLIRDRQYLNRTFPGLHLMEFKNSQKTVFHKLYYEYFFFKKLSRQKKAYLWFSLNDVSPNVEATLRAVYIHNATPFYKFSWMDLRFPSRVLLQTFYYDFFLRTNLKKNSFVVVQQQFMKDYVVNKLGFEKPDNVLIHRPVFSIDPNLVMAFDRDDQNASSIYMIYPAKPEVYKNVHRLTDAAKRLIEEESFSDFTLWLTMNGDENRYSRQIARTTEALPQVVFKGHLSYPVLMGHLQASDILVFPSKLETWGLPLSEGAFFNKWIIAADLPYARETLRDYRKALFFDPDSTDDLMTKIRECTQLLKGAGDRNETVEHITEKEDNENLVHLFGTLLQAN
jgi:glycosyltransferase involved in cell wall biosynthesis